MKLNLVAFHYTQNPRICIHALSIIAIQTLFVQRQFINSFVIFSLVKVTGLPPQLGSLSAEATKASMLAFFTPKSVSDVGIFKSAFSLLMKDINPANPSGMSR